jgi:hypothetical protein
MGRRCATERVIIAKVVVIKVQSNYNNATANRLGVVPDTTDAVSGPAPVRREIGDANRKVFVVDGS